jgi:hypothetical protein
MEDETAGAEEEFFDQDDDADIYETLVNAIIASIWTTDHLAGKSVPFLCIPSLATG